MKSVGMAAALIAAGAALVGAVSAQPVVLWETTGLKTPESALPCRPKVSPTSATSPASRPTRTATASFPRFRSPTARSSRSNGRRAWTRPKGLALAGGKLYAADIDKLVEIDPPAARSWRSTMRQAPRSSTTSPPMRRATSTSPIPTPAPSGASPAASSRSGSMVRQLKFPNGLYVDGDKLIVAAWGAPGTSAPIVGPVQPARDFARR